MTDDEEYGRRLLAPLTGEAGEPPGPSGVDVLAAVVTGRRRVRLRRLLTATSTAAVVLVAAALVPVATTALRDRPAADGGVAVAPGPAVPPPSAGRSAEPPPAAACTVQPLPVARDRHGNRLDTSGVTGMDPTGRIILGRDVFWIDAVAVADDTPGIQGDLVDVNSAGVAVAVDQWTLDTLGWVYRDGTARPLRGATPVAPTAIGENGHVVGVRSRSREAVPAGSGKTVPVIWRSVDAPAEDLPLPGGDWWGSAVDVAADGTVLGVVSQGSYEQSRAVLWAPDGDPRVLPLPKVDGVAAVGFAPLALGERWITGPASFPHPDGEGFAWRPVRYDRHTAAFEADTTDGFEANGANGRGWLVGELDGNTPAVVGGGRVVRLPEVAELGRHEALFLSDDGRVVAGQAEADPGRTRAVVWRCS